MKILSREQFWIQKNLSKRKILAKEKSWQEKNQGKRKSSAREKRKRQGYSWNQRHQEKNNERLLGN